MNRIVISGYYGFRNAGDEAILLSMLNSIKTLLPDAQCVVLSGNPADTEMKFDVPSVHRFNLWGIVLELRHCHLFVSGGGSLLQDVTSSRSLVYYLFLMLLAHWLGKPVMLYAQGVGPIHSSFLRKLTGWVLRKVDFITVRDRESAEFLQSLGVQRSRIKLTADVVFLLERMSLDDGKVLLNRYGAGMATGLVGVAVRSWEGDKYFGALVDALDQIADQGKQLLLIPFQYPGDMACARKLQRALRHPSKILGQACDTGEMLSLIGNLDSLIGMRLHSLIFAAVMGVPFVALDYDPKVQGFVKSVGGSSAGTMSTLSTNSILQAYTQAGQVQVDLTALKKLAAENNNLLVNILREGSLVKC